LSHSGKTADARTHLDQAWTMTEGSQVPARAKTNLQRQIMMARALVAAQAKDFSTAKGEADKGEGIDTPGLPPAAIDGYEGMLGIIALAQRDAKVALQHFKKADRGDVYPMFHTAEAMRLDGDTAGAGSWATTAFGHRIENMDLLLAMNTMRWLGQLLHTPETHERPAGGRLEVAPSIDRQDNPREGGGRQIVLLAGQLRDELLEAGIVPDDHHGSSVQLADGTQHREDIVRARHIKERVEQDLSRIASGRGHGVSRQMCPHGVGADNQVGDQLLLTHQLSDARPVPLAARVQRSLAIDERAVAPARLRVPENQQRFHGSRPLSNSNDHRTLRTEFGFAPT